jgi:hypothetical protein
MTSFRASDCFQVIFSTDYKLNAALQHSRQKMMPSSDVHAELIDTVDRRIDLAAKALFRLAKAWRDFRQPRVPNHHKVDVACGSLFFAGDRAVNKCNRNCSTQWQKHISQYRNEAGGLFQNVAQILEDRRTGFRFEIYAPPIAALLEDAASHEGAEFALQAGGPSVKRASEFGEIPPLIRTDQGGGKDSLTHLGKQAIESG